MTLAPAAVPAGAGFSAVQVLASRRALLFGNFAIGSGVMVAAGVVNDVSRDLKVGVPVAGQLITVAAVVLALASPLLAALVAGFDRRRLLTIALVWYAVGHALCALMPDMASLLPMRGLCVLGAAVFTPQAAAAIGVMAPPSQRGQAVTSIFLGWSLASVLGMPMGAWVSERYSWRWAFAVVAVLSLLAAFWLWRSMPKGVRPAALSRASWALVFSHPALMLTVAVTALSAAGQFTLFTYFAPYYKQVLGASPEQISMLFALFGAAGVVGNVLAARLIDGFGAARVVQVGLGLIAVSLLLWPLGTSLPLMAVVMLPWALGCFSSNSAQQSRLVLAAPMLAPALVALNSSAMYAGQAMGAASGGALTSSAGYSALHGVGLVWLLLAMACSVWAARRMQGHMRRQLAAGPDHG